MNDLLSDMRFWIVTIGGGVVAGCWRIVSYAWTKHESRIDNIEADMVRRKEFDQLRADFQLKHEENTERLDMGFTRIESLIERNHQDAVEGRHDTKNQILRLVEKVGVVQGRLGLNEFKE